MSMSVLCDGEGGVDLGDLHHQQDTFIYPCKTAVMWGARRKDLSIIAFLACGDFRCLLIAFANSIDRDQVLIWIQTD